MWYKQEGEIIPFTAWPWMTCINKLKIPVGFKRIKGYFKRQYEWAYWDLEGMNKVAKYILTNYRDNIDQQYAEFKVHAAALQQFYLDTFNQDLTTFNNDQLLSFYQKVWDLYHEMWSRALFIDSFDPGTDQQEIKKIVQNFNFSEDEITILLTPPELSYASERWLDFLNITLHLIKQQLSAQEILNQLKEHIRRYDFYQYSYAHPKHITPEQLQLELQQILSNPQSAETEQQRLQNTPVTQKQKINQILQKYQLQNNPLYFFQRLTLWREHRKQVNMMGCHLLHRFLEALEIKTTIPKKYLDYLVYNEIEPLLAGKIKQEILQERFDQTLLVAIKDTTHTLKVGESAMAERAECDNEIRKNVSSELQGQIACKGRIQGTAKIILDREDFSKFKQGDILVAGMTRPEHVPLMKMAAAIVTNEGGITCHAAIVSRELNIPCIIGTKIATEILKDGDVVEVNAEEGKIKILKEATS